MRIVLGYRSLATFAGSETYLLTVAEQLQLLGHEVWAYTHELGPMAEVVEARGVRICRAGEGLPEVCEALLAQDDRTAYELAERYPDSARVFVAHSTAFVSQVPPQLAETSPAVVVMNDRVGDFVSALASSPEVVRLRQPIDIVRFSRWAGERPRSRRVVAFGNDHKGLRWGEIAAVCAELGLEAELIGHAGRTSAAPERDLAHADVVIGIGRCVVEAMACGSAAYVNGVIGGDGWVTPDSYAELEADGFSGRAFGAPVDAERLRADLADWTPELGRRGKELAWLHHDAAQHAAELVQLWRRLGAVEPAPAAGGELARLARVNQQTEDSLQALAHEAGVQRHRADLLEERLAALTATRRWRLACALSAPADRARSWLRRPRQEGSGQAETHD